MRNILAEVALLCLAGLIALCVMTRLERDSPCRCGQDCDCKLGCRCGPTARCGAEGCNCLVAPRESPGLRCGGCR